ncbi:MAG: Alginate exp protein [Campylobacterota bacterium]|nr:Alginate exp protein [Campylobacterota bacterium]
MKRVVKLSLASAILLGVSSVSAQAENLDILSNIKAKGELRARYEMVDADDATDYANANAFTSRLTVGVGADLFGTDWLSAYVEMNDVRSLNNNYDDGYTDNGQERNDKVVDPEDTRLTQSYIDLKYGKTKLRAGRQMINLDNQRFVGASAWRQMFATFDGYTLTNNSIDNLNLFAGYITQVNGVCRDHTLVDTRSLLLNASYKVMDELKVTVYDYMVGQGTTTTPGSTGSDTYGIALTGNVKVADNTKLDYRAEYAKQTDASMENSDVSGDENIDADYMNFELNANVSGFLVGAGYEVLSGAEGTDTRFTTPFYSAHPFHGFADIFGATPAKGLEDMSLAMGYTSKDFGSLKAIYHDFTAEVDNTDYGTEFDVVYSRAIPGVNNLSGMLKYADFNADSEFTYVDTTKVMAMLTYTFATK